MTAVSQPELCLFKMAAKTKQKNEFIEEKTQADCNRVSTEC